MFIIHYVKSVLENLGFLNKHAKLLILGLDNAGKTTLLHLLCTNKLVQHAPTRNPISESITLGNVNFTAYDLGGHAEARKLWENYYTGVDAIIFIFDVADESRYNESFCELTGILEDDTLHMTPVIIMGNKIDLQGAMSEHQLRDYIGLHQTTGKGVIRIPEHVRPIEIFMTSIVHKQGYGTALKWVSQYL